MAGEQLKLFSKSYADMLTSIADKYESTPGVLRVILLRELNKIELGNLPNSTLYAYNQPVAPVILSTPATEVVEGNKWSYTVIASDTDTPNSELTYTFENLPYGMTYVGNRLEWFADGSIPEATDIKVIVSDSHSETVDAEQVFNINVVEPTTILGLFSTPPTSVDVDSEYAYDIIVSGVDDELVTYNLTTAPVGMVLEGNRIRYTPRAGHSQPQVDVEFTVIYGQNGMSNSFTIDIIEPTTPPSIPGDISKFEIQQSESYITGGKPIPGMITIYNDSQNAILTTDAIDELKWTDITADVHGFAIIGLGVGADPTLGLYEVFGYQYLNSNMAIRKDDLIIDWPTLEINSNPYKYISRLEVS